MFQNREHAGKLLAQQLLADPSVGLKDNGGRNWLVLSIPRGGVVIGDSVAQTLACQHDVLVVRKIGFPGDEELAIGAVAEDGKVLLNPRMLSWYQLSMTNIEPTIARAKTRVANYISLFRKGRRLPLAGRSVILVDDGIATGETLRAAILWLRSLPAEEAPAKVVVAVPVCSPTTALELEPMVDRLVYIEAPTGFAAVGQYYVEFGQVSDEDVLYLLRKTHIPSDVQ